MNILAATRCIISMWMFCIVCLYTQDQICADKTFNLQSNKNLSPKILLEEIAHECGLSLSYENGAQEALDQNDLMKFLPPLLRQAIHTMCLNKL